MTDRHPAIFCLFVLLFGLGLMKFGGTARAHDGYGGWFQPGTGKSCCNDHDCRPTTATQDMNGTWWVTVNGRPVAVPGNRIVRKATDGRCHVCESGGEIHCFNPCEPRS